MELDCMVNWINIDTVCILHYEGGYIWELGLGTYYNNLI